MDSKNIRKKIYELIKQIAAEQSKTIPQLEDRYALVDELGFRSLDVATLIALLENEFAFDPFMSGKAEITDIRTVGDLCNIYVNYLQEKGG